MSAACHHIFLSLYDNCTRRLTSGLSSGMASVSGQPQFRYTQPPSKVLHLRNLPWECTEEELIELGKPFGRIVNTKCNVGANRNQAFIEFVSHFFPVLSAAENCSDFREVSIGTSGVGLKP